MGPGDAVAVLGGGALLLLTGVALALSLRVAGAAELALASLVLAAGVAIALVEILSLGHAVSRAGLLAGAAAAAGLSGAVWFASGRPRPRVRRPSLRLLAGGARGHPVVAAVVVAAGLAAAAQLVLALAVVPNEVDGLLYHLLRSALIAQRHTLEPSGPILPGDPATMNPPNAEALVAWTMSLSHTDRLAALVQWTCLPGLGLLVFAGARLLGSPVAASAFAGAVAMLLPEPLLQSTTAQNDLLLAVLTGCVALFAVRGLRDRSRGDLVVAAAAAGLAVGTKSSALLALAFVAVLIVAAAVRFRPPRRLMAQGAVLMAVLVVALGGFAYADDLALTGDPLGGMTHSTAHDFTNAGPALNLARSAWGVFVEAPGLPDSYVVQHALGPVRSALFSNLHGSYYGVPAPMRVTVDEDTDGLGLVGLLVLVPLLVWALVRPVTGAHRLVVAAALAFAVVLSWRLGYSPDNTRLLLPGLVLTLPLLALAASRRWSRASVATLAVAGALPVILLNPHRSPFTTPALLGSGRHTEQLADYDGMARLMSRLDRILSPTAPLGVLHAPEFTSSEHPPYAFFDASLRRRVALLSAREVTPVRLRAMGLAGAVVWRPKCAGPACRVSLAGVPYVPLGDGAALVRAAPPVPASASAGRVQPPQEGRS